MKSLREAVRFGVVALALIGVHPHVYAVMDGQVIVNPGDPRWLVKYDPAGKHKPFMIAGAGDPEGFLYRGIRNSNGTRTGDQSSIIAALKGTGANAIYLMAVRSHGGDGGALENPFIDGNPLNGLDPDILNQWDTWFTDMDRNNIVIFFFFYDDSAIPFGTANTVGALEANFISTIVNRFESKKNLVWCVAEEYKERLSATRVKNIAAKIRAVDDHDHVIAVHQNKGWDFDFDDDPNIDQFAMQLKAFTSPYGDEIYAQVLSGWNSAAGRYNLNLADLDQPHATLVATGDRTTLRRTYWATAMAGAQVMVFGFWTAGVPTAEMLRDLGRLRSFFESTTYQNMTPSDALRYGSTQHVMEGGSDYILYTDAGGTPGVRIITGGTYDRKWLDPVDGSTVLQTGVFIPSGNRTFLRPSGIGNEAALWLKRR